MLVGLVASGTPLPWTAAAVLPLMWAAVESVRALRAGRMSAGPAGTRGTVFGVLGLVLICVLTLVVLLPYAVYGPAKRLQDCTAGANTAVAAAECRAQFLGGPGWFLGGLVNAG
jgi:hypothetical protein